MCTSSNRFLHDPLNVYFVLIQKQTKKSRRHSHEKKLRLFPKENKRVMLRQDFLFSRSSLAFLISWECKSKTTVSKMIKGEIGGKFISFFLGRLGEVLVLLI